MFPTHNTITGASFSYRNEHPHSSTEQRPAAPNVGQGPKLEGMNVTERGVSRLRQAAVPEAASTVVTIKAEQIQDAWKQQLRVQYWREAGAALQLSSNHLGMLENSHLITSPLRQQCEQAACHKDRNFMVLDHIMLCGTQETWANLLNFLNLTGGDVVSHGTLFREMVEDPKMVKKPASSLPERPAGTPLQTGIQTAPVVLQRKGPVATPQPASAWLMLMPTQIQDGWKDRLRTQYWKKTGATLLLSNHLGMLEKSQLITSSLRQQADLQTHLSLIHI